MKDKINEPSNKVLVDKYQNVIVTNNLSTNTNLSQLLNLFKTSKSEQTWKNYSSSYCNFAEFLNFKKANKQQNIINALTYLFSLDAQKANICIAQYASWLFDRNYSLATQKLRIDSIKSITKYLKQLNIISWEIVIPRPKFGKEKNVEAFSHEEFFLLLQEAHKRTDLIGKRNLAIVYLFAFLGLRSKAIRTLNIENIDFKNHKISILRKGKNLDSQREKISVPPQTWDTLKMWIQARGQHTGPVFESLHQLNLKKSNKDLVTTKDNDTLSNYSPSSPSNDSPCPNVRSSKNDSISSNENAVNSSADYYSHINDNTKYKNNINNPKKYTGLSHKSIWKIIKDLAESIEIKESCQICDQIGCEKCGFSGSIYRKIDAHPHRFRHFTASEAEIITDGNIQKMMAVTGHKKPETLQRYLKRETSFQRDVTTKIEESWMKKLKNNDKNNT